MKLATRLLHAGRDRDPYTGASSVPIYQCSTFAQKDPEQRQPYDYSRSDNPTREALELAIADLEGGARGLAFASGMAATSTVLLLFKPGDHIIAGEDIYGGTYRVLTTVFKQWQLDVTFVDTTDIENIRRAIKPTTRAVFVESPSNPLLKITDLATVAKLAHEHKLLAITDNTFMTPAAQRPLELGFDIVVHSATKFIGGHSDLIAGLAVTRDETLGKRLKSLQNSFGAILGPQDAWLTLRGLKTLGVRFAAQQQAAERVAQWLQTRSEVKQVFYPTLPNHPGHELHLRQAAGGGAVVSFELAGGGAAAKALLKRVELMLPAVSLGGVESILSYPPMMSHAAMPRSERLARGITDGLLRLSVGLEDVDDLTTDLARALTAD
ncbi:MAG: PLP-dependent transferase [Verrucomicrobia bacterium]|nr:MAG: PLP-dependent transferase [Verrucomicrobiota bacterium]